LQSIRNSSDHRCGPAQAQMPPSVSAPPQYQRLWRLRLDVPAIAAPTHSALAKASRREPTVARVKGRSTTRVRHGAQGLQFMRCSQCGGSRDLLPPVSVAGNQLLRVKPAESVFFAVESSNLVFFLGIREAAQPS